MDGVLYALISLLGIAVGVYLRGRYTKVGEIDAINSRLADIVKQTSATTAAAKTIENKIARVDWGEREVVTLRRAKLEELLLALYEANAYVSTRFDLAIDGKGPEQTDRSFHRIQVLTALYFQELAPEVSAFIKAYLAATHALISLNLAASMRNRALRFAEIRNEPVDQAEWDQLMRDVKARGDEATALLAEPLTRARAVVEGKAGGLINKIVGHEIGKEIDFVSLFAASDQQALAKQEGEGKAAALRREADMLSRIPKGTGGES